MDVLWTVYRLYSILSESEVNAYVLSCLSKQGQKNITMRIISICAIYIKSLQIAATYQQYEI